MSFAQGKLMARVGASPGKNSVMPMKLLWSTIDVAGMIKTQSRSSITRTYTFGWKPNSPNPQPLSSASQNPRPHTKPLNPKLNTLMLDRSLAACQADKSRKKAEDRQVLFPA